MPAPRLRCDCAQTTIAVRAIRIFSSDPEVINAGARFLVIVFGGMWFSIPMAIYTAAFNGAGDTMPPLVTSSVANWGGKVGLAYIATYYFGDIF